MVMFNMRNRPDKRKDALNAVEHRKRKWKLCLWTFSVCFALVQIGLVVIFLLEGFFEGDFIQLQQRVDLILILALGILLLLVGIKEIWGLVKTDRNDQDITE